MRAGKTFSFSLAGYLKLTAICSIIDCSLMCCWRSSSVALRLAVNWKLISLCICDTNRNLQQDSFLSYIKCADSSLLRSSLIQLVHVREVTVWRCWNPLVPDTSPWGFACLLGNWISLMVQMTFYVIYLLDLFENMSVLRKCNGSFPPSLFSSESFVVWFMMYQGILRFVK